jgi:hypothetical protein
VTARRWIEMEAPMRVFVSAGIPRRDRETAGRVLVEITRQAGAWLDSDLGVRFGR